METVDEHGVEEMIGTMKEMHRSANTLLVRFNEFMARSRVESGRIDIEQMSLEMIPMIEQIEESCDTCIALAAEKNAQDAINDLTKITTAASRFRRKLKVRVIEPTEHKISEGSATVGQGSLTRPPMPFAVAENQAVKGKLLVVDDDRLNREMIGRRLQHMGFEVVLAEDGLEALETLRHRPFDLVLLDIMMPRLDGHATLDRIKANPQWSHIPVVMLTAVDETDSIVRCISAGAEDYVPKPFNSVILRARIEASLSKKQLHDQEVKFVARIQAEQAKSESLLLGILPPLIANRLKSGERDIVDSVPAATVLFADIVGFTKIAADMSPEETAFLLNDLFSAFDGLVDSYGMEKVKTIGDAYMAVAGVPESAPDHALRGARMALAMQQAMQRFNVRNRHNWSIRVGVHCGPLMAGIIGSRKFAYDLWGDTVNLASRLESQGEAGKIHVSRDMAEALADKFELTELGVFSIRNRGDESVYRLEREK